MTGLIQNNLLKPDAKNSVPPSKSVSSYTLFWHPAGPLLKYADGVLHIEDLNPQIRTCWRMSRIEILKLSWRCLIAACHKM
jgi:hypothetical protein